MKYKLDQIRWLKAPDGVFAIGVNFDKEYYPHSISFLFGKRQIKCKFTLTESYVNKQKRRFYKEE